MGWSAGVFTRTGPNPRESGATSIDGVAGGGATRIPSPSDWTPPMLGLAEGPTTGGVGPRSTIKTVVGTAPTTLPQAPVVPRIATDFPLVPPGLKAVAVGAPAKPEGYASRTTFGELSPPASTRGPAMPMDWVPPPSAPIVSVRRTLPAASMTTTWPAM